MLARLERDSLLVGGAGTAGAFLLWPGQPQRALGVVAGLLLVALAYAGIRAGVDAAIGAAARRPEAPADPGQTPSRSRPAAAGGFVKFFTRHAILAARRIRYDCAF